MHKPLLDIKYQSSTMTKDDPFALREGRKKKKCSCLKTENILFEMGLPDTGCVVFDESLAIHSATITI
jgi:hypothetical protein